VCTQALGLPLKVRLRLTGQATNQLIVDALAEGYRVGARFPGMRSREVQAGPPNDAGIEADPKVLSKTSYEPAKAGPTIAR
jgi:hypothetical protein